MSKRLERVGVQLAHPATSRKVATLGRVCITQPKLNGERCRVEWLGSQPLLFTSYGNQFPYLEHIRRALVDLREEDRLPFDGELYVHGWPRERIDSAARTRKKKHPDNEGLQFHIFDIAVGNPQVDRISFLEQVYKRMAVDLHGKTKYHPLKVVQHGTIFTEEWPRVASEYVAEGYEGIILRDLLSPYMKKRSNAMLKFKPTLVDYYKIVGLKEGTGWAVNMLGAFEVEDKRGLRFAVGTGQALTKEKRTFLWSMREDLIGLYLKVKHEEIKTSGGIPICTVALDVVQEVPEGHEDAN